MEYCPDGRRGDVNLIRNYLKARAVIGLQRHQNYVIADLILS
ncbi:hypothetical protein SAMN05216198_1637 [Halopseudomonas litoralis]|uniref:Uncharacterized protein n=1 Tax=Halopseudomonas litoralis TaxID=797277 RepID=A0A1H1R1Y9_9GAMM|nr:hypothetical protein SAMN05216198_1637 [Halopseudomonas litoralis]